MLIWLIVSIFQCLVLWAVWQGGRKIILGDKLCNSLSLQDYYSNSYNSSLQEELPRVAMIIPTAGSNHYMEKALRSLLSQDYPHITPVIVTATNQEPAYDLALRLKEEFPLLKCVVAGHTTKCGQKNHNTLQALKTLDDQADIYVFCDSSHIAKTDFVSQLVWPIVNREVGFAIGYHQVIVNDNLLVGLAYQISVLLMRLLQAVSIFKQPWAGAMAIDRKVFEHHQIAQIWEDNVVDDCSLSTVLMQKKIPVKLCPKATLDTYVQNHSFVVWEAWFQRQILFLKFCTISQWYLLGFFAIIMTLPMLLSCLFIFGSILDIFSFDFGWYTILACMHLGLLSYIVLDWRKLCNFKASPLAWIKAFVLFCAMFAKVYYDTTKKWHIDWHGFRYFVKKGGQVIRIEKYK